VDQIKSQVDNLSELSEDSIAELQSAIISEFEMVESAEPTAETVDAMTSLADMLDTVRGEVKRREAATEELAARATEAAARVKSEVKDTTGEDAVASAAEEVPAEAEVVVEGEPAPADETPAEEAPAEEAPAETPGQVEEGTPEEEKAETPEEEDAEDKKKPVMASTEFATETVEASAIEVEGSELSTEEAPVEAVEVVETPAEEAPVVETIEASAVETPAEEAIVAEVAAEAEVIVTEATEVAEFATEEETTTETVIAPEAQEEQAPVTASADETFQAPADRQPVIQVSEAAPVAITAGADIPGYTAGSTINNMTEVASAMEKRLHGLRRVNGGDGEQHIVASLTTSYPESRTLTTDAESNALKIAAVAGPEAIIASGGHAAPFEVKYDIFGIGSTTDRPIRDALPTFQADRGGIRFVTPPTLVHYNSGTVYDYDGAVGVWTNATDITPNSATKNSLTVNAAQENTVATDAVTLQLQFGNLMTRAYPELIARHNELALVQHAREAELNLLAKIGAASTAVTTSSLIGFGRDFLVQIRRAAVAYRSRHRIDPGTNLKAVVPQWVYDAMAADLTLSMPGDATISVSKAEIDGYLSNSNVTLVPSLDADSFGAQAGSAALLEFPDTFDWYLFAEGTFLFLDGGTLDLGIIRDSSLVGTNDYKMFIETFENVAKVGIESLKITSAISVNGVAAALRDTTGGATAAAVEY
jgi:chemotaxis protein histidine kinase CheA